MIVTLTPQEDFAPVPRIEVRLEPEQLFEGGTPAGTGSELSGGEPDGSGEVLFGGVPGTVSVSLPDGTDAVTLWRSCQGRRMKVRGGVNRFYAGAFALQDFEAGFGVDSEYELECWSAGTVIGRVPLGVAVLPPPAEKWVTVVQQPLDPRLNVVFEETAVNAPSVSRVGPASLVPVEGRSRPTVVSQGPRAGLSGVELSFAAVSREVAAAAWATVGSEEDPQLPVWLVRSQHPMLPAVFFCDSRSLREVSVNLHLGGVQSVFELTVDEVDPPAPALATSSLTYADLGTAFPTYSEMGAAFLTYSEMGAAFLTYSEMGAAFEYSGASGG